MLLSWSGGKDASLALAELSQRHDLEVVALLTTITEDHERVSMHGLRTELLRQQADALALPLNEVRIPASCDHETYQRSMRRALRDWRERSIDTVAFGDIFLADVRRYRERLLGDAGMRALFPLWGRDTHQLAERFHDDGYQATLTCVDTHQIDPRFAGRRYDRALLKELPREADPCGENGEFHTFVHAGPIFSRPVACRTGQQVLRDDRFRFCDMLST